MSSSILSVLRSLIREMQLVIFFSLYVFVTNMAAKPRLLVPPFCRCLGNSVVDQVEYGTITARLRSYNNKYS